jgi:hypothetical protein
LVRRCWLCSAFAAAFGHVARNETTVPIRLAELAPAAGLQAGGAPPAIVVMLPVRAELGGERVPIAGWAFPGALFALWAAGFGAIRASRALARSAPVGRRPGRRPRCGVSPDHVLLDDGRPAAMRP